ncbi:MAG: protein kinase domain-containing protein [Microcystaceae cyanobacterium]
MDILCTRPGCARINSFADLDQRNTLQTAQQKFCTSCGMPLILGGRYLPVKLLGQGGFGAAFLAIDRFTPTMRFCVVKQFQPSGDLSQAQIDLALKLFEREAEVLEQLGNKQDQIPDLFAFFPLMVDNARLGKADRFFYLVQEFISGKNLEEELLKKGTFSEDEIIFVLEEMLKVLDFVHSKGSIHRDIKPSNIMRDQDGRLFLLDFGAVKQIAAAGLVPGGASTGIYSMGFAPPEQMTGGQVYPATDLYALAVTCLYLLTGKTAQELFDSYHNVWNWRTFAPTTSDRLGQILDRLLLPTPKDRYQSAQEVLEALKLTVPALNPPIAQAPNTKLQPPPSAPPTVNNPPSPANVTPAVNPPPNVPVKSSPRPAFSTLELLGGAAFTGFESALVWIAATSLIPSSSISMGIWGMVTGGLIFAQWKRVIERFDLLIIAVLSSLPFWFLPWLPQRLTLIAALKISLTQVLPSLGHPVFAVLAIAVFSALVLVAIISLFQLIYQLLKRLL